MGSRIIFKKDNASYNEFNEIIFGVTCESCLSCVNNCPKKAIKVKGDIMAIVLRFWRNRIGKRNHKINKENRKNFLQRFFQ